MSSPQCLDDFSQPDVAIQMLSDVVQTYDFQRLRFDGAPPISRFKCHESRNIGDVEDITKTSRLNRLARPD